MTNTDRIDAAIELCSDCPIEGYPTNRTRCASCPRRVIESSVGEAAVQSTTGHPLRAAEKAYLAAMGAPDRLERAITAYLAALPADTAGWRMVPVEPDLAMYRALTKTLSETPEGKMFVAQWALGDFRESYQDMLAAAPPPPAGGKEE